MAEETEKTAFEQAEDIPQTAETEKQRKSEEKKRQKAEKRAAKAARRIEKEQARRERSVRKQAEKTARTPHLRERELFELWINGFEKEHQALLREYFDELNAHLSLARDEMIQFRRDFAAAIDLLLRLGCPLEEALNRLSPERLGGFYGMARHPLVPAGRCGKDLSPVHEARPDVRIPAGGGHEGAGEARASANRPALHHPALSRLCHHRAQGVFLALSGSDQAALLHSARDGYSRPAVEDRRQRLPELPGFVL